MSDNGTNSGRQRAGAALRAAIVVHLLLAVGPAELTPRDVHAALVGHAGIHRGMPVGRPSVPAVPGRDRLPGARLEVATEAPDVYLARGHCLSVAITPEAAWECGDLQVVHELPAATVRGRRYAPVLQYNSQHARPHPLVGATLTLPPTAAERADSVRLTLVVAGHVSQRRTVPASHWAGSGLVTRRLTLGFDGMGLPTGVYPYVVAAAVGGDTLTATGQLVVVNRSRSPFGAGWWLAGREELLSVQRVTPRFADSLLWVGGDGSTRVYRRAGPGSPVFLTERFSRPDSLVQTGDGFVRLLARGVRVVFDTRGEHRSTVDPAGNAIDLEIDPGRRLRRIRLPGPRAAVRYEFHYAGDRTGEAAAAAGGIDAGVAGASLARVDAPGPDGAPRTVRAVVVGDELRALRGPDRTTVAFGYGGPTGAMTRRVDRRGVAWTFDYDGASHGLARASLYPQSAPAAPGEGAPARSAGGPRATHTFGAAAAAGLAAWSPDPVSPALVHSWHDGPRDDVADVTRVWVDRHGQPTTVRAPGGATTRLARDDPRFPGLVTRVTGPTGLRTTAAYDARGNAVAVTVHDPLGDGRDATTRYAWHPRWGALVESTTPEGVVTQYGYDTQTGQRAWLEDARGPAGRVTYHYGAHGLLDSVRTPLAVRAQRFERDDLGNVAGVHAPGGASAYHLRDALGRDTLVITPIDPVPPSGTLPLGHPARTRRTRLEYDVHDRLVRMEDAGPAMGPGVPAETLRVEHAYDAEGNLLRVERAARPDRAGTGGVLRTEWRYDALGRPVVERAPDGAVDSAAYDPAGNVVRRVTRRGHVITYAYDARNRLVARALPAVSYPDLVIDGWRFPEDGRPGRRPLSGVEIPADTERFAYDADGRLTLAENRDARITRTYYPGGGLATDTLRVRVGRWDDPTTRTHGIRLTYDLDGRRTRLWGPVARHETGGSRVPTSEPVRYAYDETGALAAVTDPLGGTFRYGYDLEGRVERRGSPGDVVEHWRFDDDGRAAARALVHGSTTADSTLPGVDTLRAMAFVYDGRGKVLRARTVTRTPTRSALTTREHAYTGLGALAGVREEHRPLLPPPGETAAGLPDPAPPLRAPIALASGPDPTAPSTREETFETDAMGQRVASWLTESGGARLGTRYGYSLRHGGRLVDRWEIQPRTTGRDHNAYDASGNLIVQERTTYVPGARDGDTTTMATVAVSFYGPDERLRATDRRTVARSARANRTPVSAYQEIRYDPLGRRVLAHVREVSPAGKAARAATGAAADTSSPDAIARASQGAVEPTPEVAEWTEEFVWDGDQLLVELRDRGTRAAAATPVPADSEVVSAVQRVLYTHGAGLDDPLSAILSGVHVGGVPIPPTALMPQRDWRGAFDLAIAAPARTTSDGPAHSGALAAVTAGVWSGSLLAGHATPTGERYLRNRYYDPVQGRFTQEDPAGIAGGPSPYVFGGGDPVSYADPFGLCRVEVRYARLGSFLGRAWHHAYVVTTAPDMTRLFFRAGPSGAGPSGGAAGQLGSSLVGVVASALGLTSDPGGVVRAISSPTSRGAGGWGAISTLWGRYESGSVDWDAGNPPSERLVDDDAPCDAYIASFTRTLSAIANRRIAYDPFTTNSNAVVRELLVKAGLAPSTPPVWAPGWDTALPR